jgi:peptidoglycan/xylan/chitin deacetylase (PgdA/CDA1 family)
MTGGRLTSIIIPAHNAERTIARTLQSLLAQSEPRWEALIVDDCSADATPAIAADYASRDTRFVALKSAGRGVSAARNSGIARASGERLLFLDSDDWIDREFLHKMNAGLDNDPMAVAAYCNYSRIMPDGSGTPPRGESAIRKNPFESFARTCATAIHCVLIRKDAVVKVGGFDTGFLTCEDWDLWQRVARCGGAWVHVDELLSYYWSSESSLSQNIERMLSDGLNVIARGFSHDGRMVNAAPEHEFGASSAVGWTQSVAQAYLALWWAGVACGRGELPNISKEILAAIPLAEDSADLIACTLLDSIPVGIRATPAKLAEHWRLYGEPVTKLISSIGQAWGNSSAARRVQYRFERMLLDFDDLLSPRALSLTLGVRVDLRNLGLIQPSGEIDRIYAYLCDGSQILGLINVGALGSVGPNFWLKIVGEDLINLGLEKKLGTRSRAKMKAHEFTRRVRRLFGVGPSGHQKRLHALHAEILFECRSLVPSGVPSNFEKRGRRVQRSYDVGQESFWEDLFKDEDPWNYGSAYEQEKYRRQLELLPSDRIDRALELACAEGHFTRLLAPRVKHLLASDISKNALCRARDRCKEQRNVEFLQLDLSTSPLPQNMDLIVCSEVLYYLKDVAELEHVVRRLCQALNVGGRILTAHAFLLRDNMSRTGFDWDNPYGAETIVRVVGGVTGLALEASIQTELYRVDLFRRLGCGEVLPEPQITLAHVEAPIEAEVSRCILWNGAVTTRSEVVKTEARQCLPILMYHRIAADGPRELSSYRLPPEQFREQMMWLRRNGYHSINSEQLAWFIANNHPFVGRPVLITFDDGYEEFAEQAWPVLLENDLSAEVFIVTDHVGGSAKWDAQFGETASLMSWAKISKLASEGAFFGSHLATHSRSDELSTVQLAEELVRSRIQLEKWLDRPVTSLAAPFGCTDQRLRILAAECGYKTVFNTIDRAANLQDDPLNLPRIEVRGDCTIEQFVRRLESCQ